METIQMTAEDIAQAYASAMDSVNLINGGKPEDMDDSEWTDCVARNQEHLRIMLDKDYWTTEDLQPLRDAVGE